MKKKFNIKMLLKFQYLLILLILVSVSIVLGLRFSKNLSGSEDVKYHKVKFSEEGFIDFTTEYDSAGNKINKDKITHRKVAENDKFILYIDEETTIIKVYDKTNDRWFYSANKDGNNQEKSNFELLYGDKKHARLSLDWYDSYSKSVNFKNELTQENESHYKIKYLPDAVQVLYEIGNFASIDEYFPEKMVAADFTKEKASLSKAQLRKVINENLKTLDGRFRGNVVFSYFLTKQGEKYIISKYDSRGFTNGKIFSEAAAKYVEDNNLAVVKRNAYAESEWSFSGATSEFAEAFGTHLNSDTSPCYTNPFLTQGEFDEIFTTIWPNTLSSEDAFAGQSVPNELKGKRLFIRSKSAGPRHLSQTYKFFYGKVIKQSLTHGIYYNPDGTNIIVGGFPKFEDGHFVYEDGKPVRDFYNLGLSKNDRELTLSKIENRLTIFQVGLEFKLLSTGLKTTVIRDSLRDAHDAKPNTRYDSDYLIHKIRLMRGFTTVYNKEGEPEETGKFVIPDGSGAIINFNNRKAEQGYHGYNKEVYGRNRAMRSKFKPEELENLVFPMFGLIHESDHRALIAVVEDGAARAKLYADTARGISNFNYAYFDFIFRDHEDIEIGNLIQHTFPKFASEMAKSDTSINYLLITDVADQNIMGIAKYYTNYLADFYKLEIKNSRPSSVANISYLGAFQEVSLKAGFLVNQVKPLTTFDQQKEINELLTKENIKFSSTLSFWTKDAMEPFYRSNIKVSPKIGGQKGAKAFLKTNEKNAETAFLVNTMHFRNYSFPFGDLKYTARTIGNNFAVQRDYSIASLEENSQKKTHFLNPYYYENVAQITTNRLKKFGIKNVKVEDLGSMMVTHYEKKRNIYHDDAIFYQKKALELYEKNFGKLVINMPFDYAFKYTKRAINVPFVSSAFGIFDSYIPFYQIVCSNFFDYSSQFINGQLDNDENWFMLNALASGSNLSYRFSYTDPVVLIKTDYTNYYKAYYKNWIDVLKRLDNVLIENLTIKAKIIDFENLYRDVTKTTYVYNEEKFYIIVNKSPVDFTYDGNTIKPNAFLRKVLP